MCFYKFFKIIIFVYFITTAISCRKVQQIHIEGAPIIPGSIKDDQYSNLYFSLKIPQKWEVMERNDVNILLLISETTGAKSIDKPNLIIVAVDSLKLTVSNINSLVDYKNGLIGRARKNPKLELIGNEETFLIGSVSIYKYTVLNSTGSYTFEQTNYFFAKDGFYFSIICTKHIENEDNTVNDIVKSLKFKI